MRKIVMLTVVILALTICCWGNTQAQPIEDELYLITPVSKDVHDPVLKAFASYAKKKWNIDVKTSAIPKGTPVAYGQILEWKGNPQADIFWGRRHPFRRSSQSRPARESATPATDVE